MNHYIKNSENKTPYINNQYKHSNHSNHTNNPNKIIIILFGLFVLLLITILLGLLYGSVSISFYDILHSFLNPDPDLLAYTLIRTVRLPRVLGGLFAGIGLSVSGVILQSIMNNSLASPNTIGVNAGAGFAVLIILVIFPSYYAIIPTAAFFGAFLTTLLVFTIAYKTNASRITIVLAGITISSFINAGINTVKLLYPDVAIDAITFMIGSLSNLRLKHITYPIIYITIAFFLAMILAKAINVISLGDGIARSLGLNVTMVRFTTIILASSLAGSVVSYAGLLGFVGIIVPHICRYLVGNDVRYLIPCSALFGGTFVILCDLLGRVLFTPYELPVGIIMAFIGGPFFIVLLLKQKGRSANASI